MQYDITVITPTYRRPKDLWVIREALNQQDLTGLRIENLIVSDGPQSYPHHVLKHQKTHSRVHSRVIEKEHRHGEYGAKCKDIALEQAKGRYVVFWDDDNWFYPHALRTHLDALHNGYEISVCQMIHAQCKYKVIPNFVNYCNAGRKFVLGNIDTGCFMIETELAKKGHWYDRKGRGTDHRYFSRVIESTSEARVVFNPVVIGAHL